MVERLFGIEAENHSATQIICTSSHFLPSCSQIFHVTGEASIGVQGVQTRLKRNVRFESK